MFGSMARYYLDNNMGRRVTPGEAFAIVRAAQKAGLVTQPSTSENPNGMCNCCGDCCGVLRALNRHPRPAELVIANHRAQVDREACTGCGTCLPRCQMGAIALDGDDLAEVKPERCIGCGLCVTACPVEALALVARPAEEQRVPPTSMAEQMLLLAQKRGLL